MRGHAWLKFKESPWAGAAANSVCAAHCASTPKHVIDMTLDIAKETTWRMRLAVQTRLQSKSLAGVKPLSVPAAPSCPALEESAYDINILTQIIRTQLRLQEILYHVHTPIIHMTLIVMRYWLWGSQSGIMLQLSGLV